VAIGPGDLDRVEDEKDKEQLARLEKEIDAGLRTHYRGDNRTVVPISSYPRRNVALELERRYTRAGWGKVDFHDDQRDGASATLTKQVVEGVGAPGYYGHN